MKRHGNGRSNSIDIHITHRAGNSAEPRFVAVHFHYIRSDRSSMLLLRIDR